LIDVSEDEVEFWARPQQGKKHQRRRGMNVPEPYRLNGRSFMQRWTLHVLPKGFTRSRCYGGYHGSKRSAYLSRCRELLQVNEQPPAEPPVEPVNLPEESANETRRLCPHCDGELQCLSRQSRPSWKQIFQRDLYRTDIYSPQHHLTTGRSPPD
jgi:hypothetical protein